MTTQIDAGSYSPDAYNSWAIGPDSPLAPDAGGTGVSNPTAPISSGSASLAITAISGCSGPSIVAPSLIDSVSTVVGSKVNVVTPVSFTASAATAVFDVTVPTATTANFADTAQASGVAVVTSGTGGGSLTSALSQSATKKVRFTLALGGTSGTYTANLAFSYIVN